MKAKFPRTTVGGVSLSRTIVGTNWMLGWSHRTPADDSLIKTRHAEPDAIADLLEVFINAGVDTVMGLFVGRPHAVEGSRRAEERTGKRMLVVYSDLNGYDVETYIQIYNCMGFLMQVEIEYIHKVIWGAKKPVMTIKPMAAGRVTPFVGLTFSWHTIRPRDMVTVGCLTPQEAAEDIEYSLAALENRPPDLAGRSSPNKTAVMK